MRQLVITAVGPDRPGLVDELAGFLTREGGNIADSRMVNLRGQFAMILLVEAPDPAAERIAARAAEAGAGIGLTVTVAVGAAVAPGTPGAPAPGMPFKLRTYAMDQPGIVHRITALLHMQKINIEELQTRLQPGSVSGAPLFAMELTMTVPAGVPVKTLRGQLETLCDAMNCDFEMTGEGPRT